MPPDPISDAAWRWLRDNFGDFVVEEPGYAPKLLALRDTRKGTDTSIGAVSSISVSFRTEAQAAEGIIKFGRFSLKKG